MSKYWEAVKWIDISKENPINYESKLLKLNCDKALDKLNWRSTLCFDQTVKMTAEWYKIYFENNNNIDNVTFDQIRKYQKIAKELQIKWAL